jgi:hypothetical protein
VKIDDQGTKIRLCAKSGEPLDSAAKAKAKK